MYNYFEGTIYFSLKYASIIPNKTVPYTNVNEKHLLMKTNSYFNKSQNK